MDTAPWPTVDWQSCAPEEQGIDPLLSQKIDAYVRLPKGKGLFSVLVIRNGWIVSERYYAGFTRTDGHQIMSVVKSIYSTLIGVAIQKGLIQDLDEPIFHFLPQYEQFKKRPELKQIRLRHVLSMSSGLYWQFGVHGHQPLLKQILKTSDWVGAILDLPLRNPPGTHWAYKEADSILASAIVHGATGLSADDFGQQSLFAPLGIASPVWPSDPQGNSHNYPWLGPGVPLTARSMAKLGYLLLKDGRWEENELLPSWYVQECGKPCFQTDWTLGQYGLMWWIKDGTLAANGWGGQRILTHRGKNLVIVTQGEANTAKSKDYDIVETVILPAVR
jgi:CubicO group peptidase (beta-lactamase class C family)